MVEKSTIFQCKNQALKIAQNFWVNSGIWIYDAMYCQKIAMKLNQPPA